MRVGFPETAYLDRFAYMLKCAFGHDVWVVGSASKHDREWHDIDLVMVLPDEEYKAMGFEFGTGNECSLHDPRWVAISSAFSELGRKLTGLPIDFKFQSESFKDKEQARVKKLYPDRRAQFLGGIEWAHQQERYRKILKEDDDEGQMEETA